MYTFSLFLHSSAACDFGSMSLSFIPTHDITYQPSSHRIPVCVDVVFLYIYCKSWQRRCLAINACAMAAAFFWDRHDIGSVVGSFVPDVGNRVCHDVVCWQIYGCDIEKKTCF